MLGYFQATMLRTDVDASTGGRGFLLGGAELGPQTTMRTLENMFAIRLLETPYRCYVNRIVAQIDDLSAGTEEGVRYCGGILTDATGNTILEQTEVKLIRRSFQRTDFVLERPVLLDAAVRFRAMVIADLGTSAPRIARCDNVPGMLGQTTVADASNAPVPPPGVWAPVANAKTSTNLNPDEDCPMIAVLINRAPD
jgi:hypothetical protein